MNLLTILTYGTSLSTETLQTWQSVGWQKIRPHENSILVFIRILSGGQSVWLCIQLVLFYNHRHSPRSSNQLNIFNEINHLKSEFSRLSTVGCNPYNNAVAQSSFSTLDSSRAMTMLASTSIRLPFHVIESNDKSMNTENPDLCTGQT